jgi:Protein of unknown function (DUF3179)
MTRAFRLWSCLVSAAAVLAAVAGEARGQEPLNRDRSGHSEIRGELPIKTATRAVECAQAPLKDQEIVIGIVLDGSARAYPVNLMWSPENEVVNDTLGTTPIAASW